MICACVLTIFEFNRQSSSWSTFVFAPWLILMHNYMYMAFIPNPFNILLASPMEQTFLYNLMSLFLHRNCHSLSSLNAYIDVDGFHPPIHPIFFMHCKWNFPSNVYLSANICPLGLSLITKTTHGDYMYFQSPPFGNWWQSQQEGLYNEFLNKHEIYPRINFILGMVVVSSIHYTSIWW